MKEIAELKILFDEINTLKNKASMNVCQFCSELTDSDDDEYLTFHFSLLEQKKRYFQPNLKLYFSFRQNREKAHYFLKDKLQNMNDEQLKNDIEDILDDINFHTLEELQQWVRDIKNGNRSDTNKLITSVTRSSFVEFHYKLITDRHLDVELRKQLQNKFQEHGEKAEILLLGKLENDEDIDFQAEIIFILGSISEKSKYKNQILAFARKFAESEDDYTRDRAIIVLGWVGTMNDTDILRRHLLEDEHPNCRAWSASSYMQMWFRNKRDALKLKAFEAYKKALDNEKDYFVLSVILSSVQELGKTKLGISQTALDEVDQEKIDTAKTKAMKFLERILKPKA
ncbi:HEAT repeat domain-containing protein [Chryseobacterium luteum]|uniref:HEAT repeat domain-containing protein n=1 Tax=Chryseobacterium luteum TaxID=421531 RepID=UPI00068D63D5|nr:HEAT repeat domain-containing protein [Chryseobacterium luteum]